MRGIKEIIFQDLTVLDCQQIGLVSLTVSQIGENSIQINNKLSINNFNLTNYSSQNLAPAFALSNLYTDISDFNAYNLNLSNHLIQSQELQLFEIFKSTFKNIVFMQPSSTISCQNSQNFQIKNIIFQNIQSIEYPSSLQLLSINQILITNSEFKLNSNNLKGDKPSSNSIHGNINIQVCKNLTITQSNLTENKSFGDGGILYLRQIVDSQILLSNFTQNYAIQNSGGAIYANNSTISIINCNFENNFSVQERGGAICSDQTNLQIKASKFKNNNAIIGGAVYYNTLNSIKIDKRSFFFNNQGIFFGNNLGSFPKEILKVDYQSKKTFKYIMIQNFQSGNYTKSLIYLQFFDEENQILNFRISQNQSVSESILQEMENYQIYLKNYSNMKGLVILFGEQLQLDKEKNLFQFNITAGSIGEQTHELQLASKFQGQQISIDLEIQFRNCIVGEIKYPKQDYVSCDKCQSGTYSLVDPNQDGTVIQCLKCPENYATNCYSNQIILRDSFWRESQQTDQIYPCQLDGCSETTINSINGCIQGYIGPICSSCDYKGDTWGESYAQVSNECVKCTHINNTYAYFVLQISFCIFYILICLNSQVKKAMLVIKLQYLRQLGILQISKTKFVGQDSQILIKIFLSYLQIFTTCVMSFSDIPNILSSVIKFGGDPVQITYKSLDCALKDSTISLLWLNRLILQSAQLVFVCLVIIASRLFIQKSMRKFYMIQKYLIFVFYYYYPSVTKMLISLCICSKIGSKYYMQNDLMYQCWVNNYLPVQLILVYPLSLAWCIGIPLLLLYKMKQAIQKGQHDSIKFILSYQFIQLGYKDQFYYWEIIKIFKKLIIMIILNLNYDKAVQLLLILAVCYFYQYLASKCNPYQQTFMLDLEVFLLMLIILSIILIGINNYINGMYQFSIITTIILVINIFGVSKVVFLYYKFAFIQMLKKNNLKLKSFLKRFKIIKINFTDVKLLRVSQLWKQVYLKTFNHSFSQHQIQKKVQSIQKIAFTSQIEIVNQIKIFNHLFTQHHFQQEHTNLVSPRIIFPIHSQRSRREITSQKKF